MKSRDLAYIALFAAITVGLGQLGRIEVGSVPITAQTLGVMLAGAVLGARRGFLALLLFVVLVAIGLPVLSGGRGGLSVFAGASAGFVLSWPVAAFVVGWLTERFWTRYNLALGILANVVGGILVVYAVGLPVMKAVTGLPWSEALWTGGAVFVPGDLLKAVIAAAIAVQVRRAYPVIERPQRELTAR